MGGDNMTDNELLLALSDIIDKKLKSELQPIKDDIRNIKLDIENNIKPQINLLAENFVPASKRYEKASAQIEAMQNDIDLLKRVVQEHSDKLNKTA